MCRTYIENMSLDQQTGHDVGKIHLNSPSETYEIIETGDTNYNALVNKVRAELVEFGLTPNEAKIYFYLAKYGPRRATELSKSIHMPRTETYHLLSGLQSKGLVAASYEYPIRFNAVSFNKALKTLVDLEKQRLQVFERKQKDLQSLWNSIPDLKIEEDVTDQKFQILEGQAHVYYKARDMRDKAREEILVLGYEKDYMKLYHYNFADGLGELLNHGVDVKLLGTFSSKSIHIFKEIDSDVIRQIPSSINNASLCFVIVDRSELLFFIKNTKTSDKRVSAIWTDSKTFLEAMQILFSELWKNAVPFKQVLSAERL